MRVPTFLNLSAVNVNDAEQVILNWKAMYNRMSGIAATAPIPLSMMTTALATNARSQIVCQKLQEVRT